MIKIEEKLKENGKLADFERAVVLNDLQSIYVIIEDLIDNSEPVKSVVLDNVSESFRKEIRLSLEHHQEEEKEQARLNNYSKAMYHNTYVGAIQEVLIKMGNYSR